MADGSANIVKEVVGTSFAVVIGVSDNRQITFQSGFADDEPDSVIDARIDRIMRLADRQRAIYEIPGLKAERLKYQQEIDQYEADVATAEAEHKRAQESLDVQIVEFQVAKKKAFEDGYAEHRNSGRTGSYTPKGHTKSAIDRIEAAIEEASRAKKTNENEREQFYANIKTSIDMRRKRIAQLDEQIADLEGKT